MLFSVLSVLVFLVVARSASKEPQRRTSASLPPDTSTNSAGTAPAPSSFTANTQEDPAGKPEADQLFRRDGYVPIRGGVLHFPSTFASSDGAYDLLIHFHGNVKVVVESAEVANLSAIVAVINLGVGSAVYENEYAAPGTYEGLLKQIRQAVHERGLAEPRLRRVALASWSAGYGAISTILQVRRGTDPLDAIVILDGLHCGRLPERRNVLNPRQLAPFVQAARVAASGEMLFLLTHSDIDPVNYVSSKDTASYLLNTVHDFGPVLQSEPKTPANLHLKAAVKAVDPKFEKPMEPTRDMRVGGLHVLGYRGHTREHHAAHLLQMGATALPELAARWSSAKP